MHAILATWPIKCYSYSYCVGGSGICMLILCCCICSIFGSWFPEEEKLDKIAIKLSISLPSSFRGHPGLAKYCTVWATFSRYFLLDAFSMACAIWLVSAYTSASRPLLGKSPQQFDCKENWIYAYRTHQFSQNGILPVQIYEYYLCWVFMKILWP